MERIAVMLKLCVPIPRGPITVRVKMDMLETAIIVLVFNQTGPLFYGVAK